MKKLVCRSYPVTHLLNPEFPYVSSLKTDIRVTFNKHRKPPTLLYLLDRLAKEKQ